MTPLQQAAQEVIDRWDSPMWRYQPATADYIAGLRTALEAEQAQSQNGRIISDANASREGFYKSMFPVIYGEQAQPSDKSRLDWLEQNLFNRENLDLFGKDSNMWVMFSPVGVQGSARAIIDAAMGRDSK